ncbi:ABC transporter [Desulfonema ishimotonii]|uniref:ABC transporter n=1 Tax=Desulfonema ishimotonii TaxID=45657 RepID=A0A401G251_9BACT|nr:GldG family protein [Desulfonema ishimotonii]GBC63286.1 ABC transporter [Desulfonema ishimotonii]
MSDKENAGKLSGKSLFSGGGLLIVLVILILINLIFSRVNLRWDATGENLYSLSDGTRQILSDLKQDVVIKVFYSQDAAEIPVHIKNYAKRVLDFLDEYENYGKGRITVEIHNPKPDSEEEDWAIKYGIEGANLPTGDKVYFGLVAMAADQEEAIPMFDPTREQQLEYDITRIISRVQHVRNQKIGVISSLPVFGMPAMGMRQQGGAQPWLFITELKKSYEVREIAASDSAIDPDTDLLMLIHPKHLSDALQYAIDQYVVRGGRLMVFADPFSVSDPSQGQDKASSSLEKLFAAWGVEMKTDKALLDFDHATKLRTQNNQIEENPLWLSVVPDAFNTDDIVTSQLESMLLPVAGVIRKAEGSAYEYESLMKSSANSSLTDAFRVRFGGAEQFRRDFKATGEQYDIAVKLRGKFETAFPQGRPESPEKPEPGKKAEEKAEHLAGGKEVATIIVMGDADFLFDNYYVSRQNFLGFNISRMFNDNLNFLLNSSEMLTGSEALISIRSRGKFERPFTRVQALEKKAQARWLVREQELTREAEETNQKLQQLEQQKDSSQKFLLSAQQEAEIRQFQEKKQRINKELKLVRRNLRADIESLGNVLKFINILLMVFLVTIAGIAYAVYRHRR